ncbi:hypothetical protein F3Y22_tig00110927pilonHSYRG00028 [Hibiscus syriacus]|uniref:RNase H type-1 domain-containing protein n=1 Tax=Hibiscus syriacus TaxID=106335 RepID=A0A6A2ZDU4_HIBSY|nr:hypothetical protein F3Y22_tig00110927pilonHSYRG00028 [Hibiscus syriacus]
MQSAVLPRSICTEIERHIRRFIWGIEEGKKGLHLVKWQEVCKPIKQGGLGFQNLANLNEVFLTKIAFNILAKKDHLWVRLIRAKYKCSGGIPDVIQSTRCSTLWRGLATVWTDVRNYVSWCISNGKLVDFWFDAWLDDCGPLIDHMTAAGAISMHRITVADMTDGSGNWWWTHFEHLLPRDILLRIAAKKGPLGHLTDDSVGWNLNVDRRFSVKSVYEFRSTDPSTALNKVWVRISEFQGLQKIKLFLWLCCTDRVLTNAERFRRHLTTNSECPIVLRRWRPLTICCVAALRLLLFGLRLFGRSKTVWEYTRRALMDARILQRQQMRPGVALQGWSRPPFGWVKINSDGARHRESILASCGGVLWNSYVLWLLGFARFIGICSVLEAELWGVYQGLCCAKDGRFNQVIVKVDSSAVLKEISDSNLVSSRLLVVHHIAKHLEGEWTAF